jgi:hypothetical protein
MNEDLRMMRENCFFLPNYISFLIAPILTLTTANIALIGSWMLLSAGASTAMLLTVSAMNLIVWTMQRIALTLKYSNIIEKGVRKLEEKEDAACNFLDSSGRASILTSVMALSMTSLIASFLPELISDNKVLLVLSTTTLVMTTISITYACMIHLFQYHHGLSYEKLQNQEEGRKPAELLSCENPSLSYS